MFVEKSFVLLERPFFAVQLEATVEQVFAGLNQLGFEADTRIAQVIFLLGQGCFTVQDRLVQLAVFESKNDIAFLNHRTFFDKPFLNLPTFDGIQINGGDWFNLANYCDIIVKQTVFNGTDG